MAENYKHLYHQMKKMVEKYQDEIVPGLRAVIEKQEKELNNVVHCRDCQWFADNNNGCWFGCQCSTADDEPGPDDYCSFGERITEE